MKKLLFSLVAVMLLIGCKTEQPKQIVVKNTTELGREKEMVEVKVAGLNNDFSADTYVLTDEKGNEVEYQVLKDENDQAKSLLFLANVPANSSAVYKVIKGEPKTVTPKTYARYIPERKDDFAWENEFAAYRMYGPALAKENPSNGVDLWLKRTDELIVDKFYHDELQLGLSYHIDHGQGLDCYKVGHTLGAGGIAPYTDQLLVGNHYTTQELLINGPLRSVFKLTYDSVQIGDNYYTQTITITTDAGSIMNKAVVHYEGVDMPIKLAGGIFIHDGGGIEFAQSENNVIGYAENAVSDAGVPSGRNYVGVYMPGVNSEIKREGEHLLIMSDYQTNFDFTYYFGGGWSKWGFPEDNDWFTALIDFSDAHKYPLEVSVK